MDLYDYAVCLGMSTTLIFARTFFRKKDLAPDNIAFTLGYFFVVGLVVVSARDYPSLALRYCTIFGFMVAAAIGMIMSCFKTDTKQE